jgi:protein-S-isoprenylcysteine O-methyltransferase Ste14
VTRVPPPLVALGAGLVQRALTGSTHAPPPVRLVGTAAVALTSASLAVTAARQFRRRGTTLDPVRPEQASALVTTGPNSVTRNPMYVGLTGLLVAHALYRGSWVALFPVAGFVVLNDRLQIRPEELALATKFGAAYEAYREAVPRWVDRRSFGL